MKTVTAILLLAIVLAGGEKIYFNWRVGSLQREHEMIMDLEWVNQQQRAMINAGPSVADLELSRSNLLFQLRAESEKRRVESDRKLMALHNSDVQAEQLAAHNREVELQQARQELRQTIDYNQMHPR